MEQLEHVGDLERLISKVAVGRINPREVVQMRNALTAIEPMKELCRRSGQPSLHAIGEQLNPCAMIRDRIALEIEEEAPSALNRGNVIRHGVNAELDEPARHRLLGQGLPQPPARARD